MGPHEAMYAVSRCRLTRALHAAQLGAHPLPLKSPPLPARLPAPPPVAARHVHKLSTMERAIGGPERFPEQSPAVILANALR